MASFAVIALTLPGFHGSAEPIGPQLRQRMSGVLLASRLPGRLR